MCSKVYKKGINLIARNIARIVVNYHLHDDLKTIFLVITTLLLTSHSLLTKQSLQQSIGFAFILLVGRHGYSVPPTVNASNFSVG